MDSFEKFGEQILPYWNEKHDHHWEKDPSYWDPCYTKTHKQVGRLEQGEGDNCFEWHSLNKCCMTLLQHPVRYDKEGLDCLVLLKMIIYIIQGDNIFSHL